MTYEYIYFRNANLDEFMERLNEYGEEGYHLIDQESFGIFLLERQVYPEMTAIGEARVSRPIISDSLYLTVMFLFVTILTVAIAARVYHWI